MNDYNNMQYEPFRYPPDYALARIHKQASMPGKKQSLNQYCPCCNEPLKKPFESWWNRSIEKDFKSFGGAVVSYFWLLKLYAITIGLIIVIYSSYLAYVTESYCPDLLQEKCTSLLGLWVVTNEDLYDLIKARDDDEVIVRLSTLRAVVFLILLVTNFLSMYVVRQVKVRYPSKESVAEYTLIFKNVTSESAELFSEGLKKEFG